MRVANLKMLKFILVIFVLLCAALLCWAGVKRFFRDEGTFMSQASNAPEDELLYLIEASERLAPDKVQVVHEMEAWVDALTSAELTELTQLYRRADAAGHMVAATRVFHTDPPSDPLQKRRLFLLFLLFDRLGERGMAPFDSFRVGYRAVPKRSVDWSELPEDVRWVIAPAERYGKNEFESRILAQIDAMSENERAEVRALKKRFDADFDRIHSICKGDGINIPSGTAEYRIYCLGMFFVYFEWNDEPPDAGSTKEGER